MTPTKPATVQVPNADSNRIEAYPTKELFISMLVRDITLKDAIGDLVDNCVDGVRSLSKNKNYSGYYIDITATNSSFIIKDNCGGFTVETARKYAFRFGRPNEFSPVKGSVGQFGIGMKRAIFKLGNKINISSTTKNTHFAISIDVNNWRNNSNWEFVFDEKEENGDYPKKDWGTTISITDLTREAHDQFSDLNFINNLMSEIGKENMYNINSSALFKRP